MLEKNKTILKVYFPQWLKCAVISYLIIISVIFMLYILKPELLNLETSFKTYIKFIFLIFVMGFWFLKFLFYKINVTEIGLETQNPFGSNKSCLWSEIIEIRRTILSIFYDCSYVILNNKTKIILLKTMKNYKILIELIKERAPNLKEGVIKESKEGASTFDIQ